MIRNAAAANALIYKAENWRLGYGNSEEEYSEEGCGNFEEVYSEEALKAIMANYAEIPAGIRPLLLGHVMHQIMMQAAFWSKCEFHPPVRLYPAELHNHPLFCIIK